MTNVTALGNEARRLDDEGAQPQGPGASDSTPAFGHTAFMECLLRICFRHLHGSGLEVKAALPPSLKGLWLLTFIHFQFDRLLQAHRSAPPATEGLRNLHSRKSLPPILSEPLRTASIISRAAALRRLTTLEVPDCYEDLQLGDVQYSSCLARLLDAHPDLFQRYLVDGDPADRDAADGNAADGDPEACGEDGGGARPASAGRCSTCGRRRGRRGVGSPLCHACSGVDARPLSASPLRAVVERRQLLRLGA